MSLYIAFIDLTKSFDLVSSTTAATVSSGVEQGSILTRTLFGIFFMLLQYAKTKVTEVLIHELLFSDDAALTSHTEDDLQQLVHCLFQDCEEFGLTISLKKTQGMARAQTICHTLFPHGREQFGYCGELHLPWVHYLQLAFHRCRG